MSSGHEAESEQGSFVNEDRMFSWLQYPGDALAPPLVSTAWQRVQQIFGRDFDHNLLPMLLGELPNDAVLVMQLYFAGLDTAYIAPVAPDCDTIIAESLERLTAFTHENSPVAIEVSSDAYEVDRTAQLEATAPIVAGRFQGVLRAVHLHTRQRRRLYEQSTDGVNAIVADFSAWLEGQEPDIQLQLSGYRAFFVAYLSRQQDGVRYVDYWKSRYPALPLLERMRHSGRTETVIDAKRVVNTIVHAASDYHTVAHTKSEQEPNETPTASLRQLSRQAFGLTAAALEWQSYALCPETDPEAFFPEQGGSTAEAKRVCLQCEVRSECLDYALRNDERFGIWGGLSERERRRLKKRAL